MCHSTTSIKLCTCGADFPRDSYWELFPGGGLRDIQMVGEFIQPAEPPLTTRLLKAKIEDDLNNANCFDFPYSANTGDVLRIHVGRRSLDFVYFGPRSEDDFGHWIASERFRGMGSPSKTGTVSI